MVKFLIMTIINWKTTKKYKILIIVNHFQQISTKRIIFIRNFKIKLKTIKIHLINKN